MPEPFPPGEDPNFLPIHIALIERLPDEGETVGWAPLVREVKALVIELNRAAPPGGRPLTSPQLGGELRSLADAGYTVPVRAIGGRTLGWQRTAKAAAWLAQRDAASAPASEPELPTVHHHYPTRPHEGGDE